METKFLQLTDIFEKQVEYRPQGRYSSTIRVQYIDKSYSWPKRWSLRLPMHTYEATST